MTGAAAEIGSAEGDEFKSLGGAARGKHLELQRGKRIVQSWRDSQFPEGAEDSQLEISFIESGGGTRVVINHSSIPEGHGERCHADWGRLYFKPMLRYFTDPSAPAETPRRAAWNPRLNGNVAQPAPGAQENSLGQIAPAQEDAAPARRRLRRSASSQARPLRKPARSAAAEDEGYAQGEDGFEPAEPNTAQADRLPSSTEASRPATRKTRRKQPG